jgi:hypothetical protein
MAISEHATMSAVSISTSEISIISGTTTLQNDTTDGVYQLWVDAANMAKGDEFKIRIYEKVKAAGTKRQVFAATLSDVQSELFATPMLILLHGWDMTIIKVAGTDRAFDASIRKVA